MKVKFLKKHITFNKGDETELSDKAANYLIRVKAVEEVTEKEEKKTSKEKKEVKPQRKPTVKGPKK